MCQFFNLLFSSLEIKLKKLKNKWFQHANRNQVFLIFQISQELQRNFEIADQLFSVKNVFLASPLSKLSKFLQKI